MPPLLTEEESALDPYALLNLDTSADEKAVRKAYRQLSLKYHPDRNPDPAAAAKFREISLSLEILVDHAKRAYVDTRLEAERVRKERYAELDKKRKKLVDDLNAREEEAKKARVDQVERGKRMQEEERVMEEGRRMMEEAKKRRAASAQAAAATNAAGSDGHANGQGASRNGGPSGSNRQTSSNGSTHTSDASTSSRRPQPPITPASLSLTLQIPATHTFYTANYATVLSSIEQTYAPVAALSLKEAPEAARTSTNTTSKPKKGKLKPRKAIVQFNDWPECWACWKDHCGTSTDGAEEVGQAGMDERIGRGDRIKAKWVTGETPDWVTWAEELRPSSVHFNPATTNTKNGSQSNQNPHPSSSALNGAAASTTSFNIPTAPSFPSMPSFSSAPSFASFGSTTTTSAADVSAAQQAKRDAEADQKKRMKDYEDMILFNMRRQERAKLEEQIRRDEAAGEA